MEELVKYLEQQPFGDLVVYWNDYACEENKSVCIHENTPWHIYYFFNDVRPSGIKKEDRYFYFDNGEPKGLNSIEESPIDVKTIAKFFIKKRKTN